jgi:hypothetical protein
MIGFRQSLFEEDFDFIVLVIVPKHEEQRLSSQTLGDCAFEELRAVP